MMLEAARRENHAILGKFFPSSLQMIAVEITDYEETFVVGKTGSVNERKRRRICLDWCRRKHLKGQRITPRNRRAKS